MPKRLSGTRIKWTQELRKIMYARLVMEFGSYDTWGNSRSPSDTARFKVVLRELATYFSDLTGESFEPTAVDQQVNWACTKQSDVKAGHARTFILNKAAALEMGFLKSADLTKHLLAGNAQQ